MGPQSHKIEPASMLPSRTTLDRVWLGLALVGMRGGITARGCSLLESAPQSSLDLPGGGGCLFQPQFCLHRKNYEALCEMYEKIQPLLENLHRNFMETRNNIGERSWVGRVGWRGGLETMPASSSVMSRGRWVPWFLGAASTGAWNFAG